MAHHSVIYGRINGATWKTEDYYKLHRLNEDVISKLPEMDEHYPWINRSMFAFPNEQGVFRDQVITFGASYKSLEYEWAEWLEKFEGILQKLFWFDVTIHAEFEVMGTFRYEWLIDYNTISEDNWHKLSPEPITKWRFTSDGPRDFRGQL